MEKGQKMKEREEVDWGNVDGRGGRGGEGEGGQNEVKIKWEKWNKMTIARKL